MLKVEENIAKVEKIYSQVTGKKPKITDTPYAPIPPEVDAESYVKENFKRLLENMQHIDKSNGGSVGIDASSMHRIPLETPKMNVFESEEHWSCELMLSGVTRSDVSIQIHHGLIRISALRHPKISHNAQPLYIEAPSCRYERLIPLPPYVKNDSVHAKVEDGLLYIHFKKESINQKQEINVTVS